MAEDIGPSCLDLGGNNCKGWLWYRNEEFVFRWCELRNRTFQIFSDSKGRKAEVNIMMQESVVSQVSKAKSNNKYFKIKYEKSVFLFGTKFECDHLKWFSKLKNSATGVENKEKDESIEDSRPEFIVKPDKTVLANNKFKFCGDQSILKNTFSISEEIDSSKKSFVQKVNENQSIICPSKIQSHPIIPPRRKASKTCELGNEQPLIVEKCVLDKLDHHSKSELSGSANDTKTLSRDLKNLQNINDESFKDPRDTFTSISEKRSSLNIVTETFNTERSLSNPSDNKYSNKNNSNYIMDATKEVVALKRLIRDKELLLKEIDGVLKSSHLPDTVSQFWDEHGEKILQLLSRD